LRLPVLNETHTNIYTGPRLDEISATALAGRFCVARGTCVEGVTQKFRLSRCLFPLCTISSLSFLTGLSLFIEQILLRLYQICPRIRLSGLSLRPS
jgi:hypothetical protein